MKKYLKFSSLLSSLLLISALYIGCGKKEDAEPIIPENSPRTEAFNNWFYTRMEDSFIYRDREQNICLLDFDTMEHGYLCNVPNCSHTTEDCIMEALRSTSQLPVIYNGNAYYFENHKEFAETDGKRCLDMSFKVKKYDFAKCEFSDIAEVQGCVANDSGGCYLTGSEYYFTTCYGNPVYDPIGNVMSSSNGGGGNLFGIDLATGKVTDYGEIFDYEKLKDEYPVAGSSTSVYLMGKIDDQLYIGVSYNRDEWTEEMKNNNEIPRYYGISYTFDIKTKRFEQIDDYFNMCSMNGYHTYFEDEKNSMLTLKNTETGELFAGPKILHFNAMTIFGGKPWHDDAYCYDIKTGSEIQLTQYDSGHVVAEYGDSYIFYGNDRNGNIILDKLPKKDFEQAVDHE